LIRFGSAPHVVTLHFRGLGSIGVSPYWLGDPEVRICDSESHARFGIPFDQPVTRPKPNDSSHAVAPTTGFNPTRPANSLVRRPPRGANGNTAHRQLSWSSFPLRRLSSGESTPPRLASPGTFRPQGFTPSRRLAPRPNVRPCFMPETPMGFSTLQGFSLTARFHGSSPWNCPLDVSPRTNVIVDAWRPSPHAQTCFSDLFRLQGFAPTANPYHHRTVTSCAMADPLLSFGASPGSCPHSQATLRVTCATLALSLPRVFPRRTTGKPAIVCRSALVRPKASPRSSSSNVLVQPRASPRSSSDGVFVQPRDEPAIFLRRCRLPTARRARSLVPTVSASNRETSPQSSSGGASFQPRDEPAVLFRRCRLPATRRARDRPPTGAGVQSRDEPAIVFRRCLHPITRRARDRPQTVSVAHHETSSRSSSDKAGCASAVSPESAGSRSEERKIPS
jgi:hypothetical protein